VTVNFPVKNLELKDYIPLPKPKENDKLRSKYDLIANIVHDGKPGEGCYRVFVQRKSEEAWYVPHVTWIFFMSVIMVAPILIIW
jgi:U4/U6.U5 tri-snRNP-associated protein 2